MEENNKKDVSNQNNVSQKIDAHVSTSMALDDEQRVKVLSPTMLVIKRFMRNKLAIIGMVIILCMFLFSFCGGIFSPYGETEVFYGLEQMAKPVAAATYNDEFQYSTIDGTSLPKSVISSFILALTKEEVTFQTNDSIYGIQEVAENLYKIMSMEKIADITSIRGESIFQFVDGYSFEEEFQKMVNDAINDGSSYITYNDMMYAIASEGRTSYLYVGNDYALASHNIFNAASKEEDFTYYFRLAASYSYINGYNTFIVDSEKYNLEKSESNGIITKDSTGELYATISTILITSSAQDSFLTINFKEAVQQAIADNVTLFEYIDESGNQSVYEVEKKVDQYIIKQETLTEKISLYEYPSLSHWLGTDGNGMDIMTRLMYGGKISLMIGFIVVFIEVLVGVALGGLAGYFGGWIDNLMMRLVDIFNCIPSMPLIIIVGSIMDSLRINNKVRIFYLMLILGILGWPGIARLVRGQILSLREQEFMIATEATGLSISKRIFKHLIPNVIPQLIVISTMQLGGIILTESTLSFLGLGVKHPYASWGNIVNAVTDVHVLTHYWFVWIPAGFLILVTVLGFNFVGDGLRDAFDPKMKR